MNFHLTIDLGNSAFDHFDYEQTRSANAVAKCLRRIASSLDNFDGLEACDTGPILDSNGNRVGSWEIVS